MNILTRTMRDFASLLRVTPDRGEELIRSEAAARLTMTRRGLLAVGAAASVAALIPSRAYSFLAPPVDWRLGTSVKIYDELDGNRLLSELTFNGDCWVDQSADRTGTAGVTWFDFGNGRRRPIDLSLNTRHISSGCHILVSGLTITQT